MRRAISVKEIQSYNPRQLDFNGEFLSLLGCPELTGSWIIWGNPGNGKTRFALQLAKYLAKFARVAYNSLEEGMSLSMKRAIEQVGMAEANGKFILLDKESTSHLIKRLKKQKSPQIIIIDSWQYTGMNYSEYKLLIDTFRTKLFIIVSHADGREPAGRVAKSIRFDAHVKIRIEGFRAFALSRYGGDGHYDIWAEKAERYYGEHSKDISNEN
jgi:hypothetical protein